MVAMRMIHGVGICSEANDEGLHWWPELFELLILTEYKLIALDLVMAMRCESIRVGKCISVIGS